MWISWKESRGMLRGMGGCVGRWGHARSVPLTRSSRTRAHRASQTVGSPTGAAKGDFGTRGGRRCFSRSPRLPGFASSVALSKRPLVHLCWEPPWARQWASRQGGWPPTPGGPVWARALPRQPSHLVGGRVSSDLPRPEWSPHAVLMRGDAGRVCDCQRRHTLEGAESPAVGPPTVY